MMNEWRNIIRNQICKSQVQNNSKRIKDLLWHPIMYMYICTTIFAYMYTLLQTYKSAEINYYD